MIKQALRPNPRRAQTAGGASIPAPVGGWDAISPLAKMRPEYAVILDNYIPQPGYVEVRAGSREYQTGAGDPVESLLVWRGSPTGVDEVYAAADTGIFQISTFGAAWPASVKTVTEPRIQNANFANDAGSFIINVNGADTPFSYNGAAWANLTITGSSGPITLTASDLIAVSTHKSRLYFVEKESLRIWFLDTNAIQGAAQLLDLGPLFKEGGVLLSIGAWSAPGSVAQDDFFVALTTEGEVAIFQGDDPADVNYWTQVGLFQIGKPIGRRSLFKFGGDLFAVTHDGVISFNQAVHLDRSQENAVAITQRIQGAFQQAAIAYSGNFGWEATLYQEGALAIYNVPTEELTSAVQFVQNIQTGAWCRFTGLNAFCWATANGLIFFGAADGVSQWDIGVSDAGEDMVCELIGAFNYFGNPSQKNFTMIRPILNATANVRPAIEINTDFDTSRPTATPTVIDGRSDQFSIRRDWNSVTGVGFCGAPAMSITMSTDETLQAMIAVGDGDTVGDGAGNDVVVDSGEPLLAGVQVIGFDILYERGAPAL